MDLIHSIEDQREFIAANVRAFARFAYGGYREVGRGVVVALPEELDGEAGEMSTGHFYYLKRSDLTDFVHRWTLTSNEEDERLQEVWAAVETYDPESSLVVVFLHEAGIIHVHEVVSPTPPALAYAAYTN